MKPVQDGVGTVWVAIMKAVLKVSATTRPAGDTRQCGTAAPYKTPNWQRHQNKAMLSILRDAERTLPETINLFGNFSVIESNSSFRFRP
jgi:S-ribosylhomocysteine lyase LuxS involved in autoinducer biosynthesis